MLPGKVPQLLINGSSGIAVGMATNIPPHNLGEISDAIAAIIDDANVSDDALCDIVKGPDFPTGGTIMGHEAIREAYKTGRGSIAIRGKAEIVEDQRQVQDRHHGDSRIRSTRTESSRPSPRHTRRSASRASRASTIFRTARA